MHQQDHNSGGYYKQKSSGGSPWPRRVKSEMTLPAELALSGNVVPRRFENPRPMYDQPVQDGDEEVYLDMTPKSTPKSSGSNKSLMSRSKSLHGSHTNSRRTTSFETSPYKNHFEENDYADMSVKPRSRTATQLPSALSQRSMSTKAYHSPGRSERAKSPTTLSRNKQLTLKSPGSPMIFFATEPFSAGQTMPRSPTPNLPTQTKSPYLPHSASDQKLPYLKIPSDRFHHSASDIKTLNRQRSDGFSHRGRFNTLVSPHRLRANEPKSPFNSEFISPYRQSSVQSQPTTPFIEGGFDKNDDDDYDDVDFGNVSVKIKENRSNRINAKEKSQTPRPNHFPTSTKLSLPKSPSQPPDLIVKQPTRSRLPSNDSNNNSICEMTSIQEKNHEIANVSTVVENAHFCTSPNLKKAPIEPKYLQIKNQQEVSKPLASARSLPGDGDGWSTSHEVQSTVRFENNQSFDCYGNKADAASKRDDQPIPALDPVNKHCHNQENIPMNEKQSTQHVQPLGPLIDTEEDSSRLVKSAADDQKSQENEKHLVNGNKTFIYPSRQESTSSITLDSEKSLWPNTNKEEKQSIESTPQQVLKTKSTKAEEAIEIQSTELPQPLKKRKGKSFFLETKERQNNRPEIFRKTPEKQY